MYICLIFHVTHSKMSHLLFHSETAPGTITESKKDIIILFLIYFKYTTFMHPRYF